MKKRKETMETNFPHFLKTINEIETENRTKPSKQCSNKSYSRKASKLFFI
jgi:hypothetical protein